MPPSEGNGSLDGALGSKSTPNADPSAARSGALLEGEEVKFNARIPENLRDAFSDLCESEGRSMSWVVREWMRQAVEEGETGL
jgi:hypothetical protein